MTQDNNHLMKKLKYDDNKELNKKDSELVLKNLINRRRFNYSVIEIISYILRCLCLRSLEHKKYRGSKEEWD